MRVSFFISGAAFFGTVVFIQCYASTSTRPNIVLIIADDLGWDDVSFHGSDQILTPNIDLLAYKGVALERYYSHAVCTPSRTALLTGKYAHTLGMQGYPLTQAEDRGLPLTEKILPQYLKRLDYDTHLVGKWHVGHSRKEYLPTNRGFNSHFGHRGGFIDYYEYITEETWDIGKVSGLDLYDNLNASWSTEGYITDVYNEKAKSIIEAHDVRRPLFLMVSHNAPHYGNDGALLQAPPEQVRAMRYIESPERRIYAAMVKKLDDSVGDIMGALSQKGMLSNTIVAFISDNGGPTTESFASNWPLRGRKVLPFEGGIRVVGLLWTSQMAENNHLWKGYMHVADWLPTLLRAVGSEPPSGIDGVDQWDNIIENKDSYRDEVFEINDYVGFASIIKGDYKLITGNIKSNEHLGGDLRGIIRHTPSYIKALEQSSMFSILKRINNAFSMEDINLNKQRIKVNCNETRKDSACLNGSRCLFNIKEDPCEIIDIIGEKPEIAEKLWSRLQTEIARTVPRKKPLFRDPRGLPKLFNYTWSTFLND